MDEKKKILLCEDDENLGMLLREYLNAKGFDTTLCADGELGYKAFTEDKYDLCVFDVMMPRKDGFTLAKEVKQVNKDVPIIFLTARNMKEDVYLGFELGADDYLTKPFSMDELVYRIEAIMRRTNNYVARPKSVYYLGDYVFYTARQSLTCGEEVFKLTTKESELLVLLCRHRNQVLGRDFALKTIWADDNYFNARSMDVYISKLRKFFKLDPRVEINNVHGRGYRLVAPGE